MLKISDYRKSQIIQWVIKLLKYNPPIYPVMVERKIHIVKVQHTVSKEMLDKHRQNLFERMAYDISKELIKQGFTDVNIMDHFGEQYSYLDSDKYIVTMGIEVVPPLKR